jgi:hypothetical protein
VVSAPRRRRMAGAHEGRDDARRAARAVRGAGIDREAEGGEADALESARGLFGAPFPSRWAAGTGARETRGRTWARWTIHNLRHAIGSHMREDLDVGVDVVSLLLAHQLNEGARVTRVYDRAQLLTKRRAALEAWAAWLERLPAPGSNVLPFREARPLWAPHAEDVPS